MRVLSRVTGCSAIKRGVAKFVYRQLFHAAERQNAEVIALYDRSSGLHEPSFPVGVSSLSRSNTLSSRSAFLCVLYLSAAIAFVRQCKWPSLWISTVRLLGRLRPRTSARQRTYVRLQQEEHMYENHHGYHNHYVVVCCLKKNMKASRPSEHPPVRGKNIVVVSHIQRIGCQPEKSILHGGQSRSWSVEQGKDNKIKKSGSAPLPPPYPP